MQAVKYDERATKVATWSWDDHELSPIELLDAIWNEIPDCRESYEVPDGMLRTQVPAFEEVVVRELLVNALVHRPYTQRGDTYLNFHPDRLEVVNPGRLPIGVTPRNILHASRCRNNGLARVFHGLKLMEREADWFGAVDACQALLDATTNTLRELNEILLRDTHQFVALLQDIMALAATAENLEAEAAVQRVIEHIDRIAA